MDLATVLAAFIVVGIPIQNQMTNVYKENKNLKTELEIPANICFCPFFEKCFRNIVLLNVPWEKSITKVRNSIAFIIHLRQLSVGQRNFIFNISLSLFISMDPCQVLYNTF